MIQVNLEPWQADVVMTALQVATLNGVSYAMLSDLLTSIDAQVKAQTAPAAPGFTSTLDHTGDIIDVHDEATQLSPAQ